MEIEKNASFNDEYGSIYSSNESFNYFSKGSHFIIDDSDGCRDFLRSFLSDFGYNVEEAVDGEDAIEYLTEDNNLDMFDAIWMDINMEPMNGLECTQKLKNEFKYQGQIIGFTGMKMSVELIQICQDSGMDYLLEKPMLADDLFECLENILNNKIKESLRKPTFIDEEDEYVGIDNNEDYDSESNELSPKNKMKLKNIHHIMKNGSSGNNNTF